MCSDLFFVILYDNDAHISIYPHILESAERLALIKRTIDINIAQQKTPRVWKTSEDNKRTLNEMLNEIDSNVNEVSTYDNINLDSLECVLAPAPYVADKLNQDKHEEWSEFLDLIGISNVNIKKKERMITDEVLTSMGGTIAGRFSRFNSRKLAFDEINKKWGTNIEVTFYDGLPTTLKDVDKFLGDEESEETIEKGVDEK